MSGRKMRASWAPDPDADGRDRPPPSLSHARWPRAFRRRVKRAPPWHAARSGSAAARARRLFSATFRLKHGPKSLVCYSFRLRRRELGEGGESEMWVERCRVFGLRVSGFASWQLKGKEWLLLSGGNFNLQRSTRLLWP
jgi:hypothetical protein